MLCCWEGWRKYTRMNTDDCTNGMGSSRRYGYAEAKYRKRCSIVGRT